MVMSLLPSPSKSPPSGTSPARPTDWRVTDPVYPVVDRLVYHTPEDGRKIVRSARLSPSKSAAIGMSPGWPPH